jgi:hypothetical protein
VRVNRMLVLLLALLTSVVSGGNAKPIEISGKTIHAVPRWTQFEEFTVFTTPQTMFYGDHHQPVSFDDVTVDEMVFIEGRFGESSFSMTAYDVHLSPPHGDPPRNQDPMTDHLCGPVTWIDNEARIFKVFRDTAQGEVRGVAVPPDVPIKQAYIGEPLIDIEFADLVTGNPVMLNCHYEDDRIVADYVVRSNDWLPPESNSSVSYDIYGYITFIWPGPFQGFDIRIETMTGDPNHQEFSYYVGPPGGFLAFPWGYLDIPEGALSDWRTITVSGEFMFTWTLRNIYSFEPRTEFLIPVTLEIRYFDLTGIDPDFVNLTYFDEETQRWRPAGMMTHFAGEHAFRGSIEHFSRYSLSVNGRPIEKVAE